MALVQKVSVESTLVTFGSLASSLMAMVLREGLDSSRIDSVFDTYKENSITNTERSMRGEVPGVQEVHITTPQPIKQLKKFLSQLMNETKQYVQGIQRNGKELYITCKEKCWKISGD